MYLKIENWNINERDHRRCRRRGLFLFSSSMLRLHDANKFICADDDDLRMTMYAKMFSFSQ